MFDLSKLNPQQQKAVTAIDGPVLILAGAGTGKTRVITYRIAYLLSKAVHPASILAVTFTNKAANEMLERIKQLLPSAFKRQSCKNEKPTICTFHSLGANILRSYIGKLGYRDNFVIYDESDQLTVVKKLLGEIASKDVKPDPKAVLFFISKIKNSATNEPDGDSTALTIAKHILKRYESALRACNAVDFDNLLLLTLRLFKEHPEVLAFYQNKYRYIMVDEYQDTNGIQFEMLKLLSAKHRNICVVGDDDQSIYGWRGAELSNILKFEEHFSNAKIIKLEQNYRSTNTILNAANALISKNSRRHPKKLWSEKGTGSKITICPCENEDIEAQTIVEWIEKRRILYKTPLEDFAVLFRTNQQSRPIETALRKAKIPYQLVGGQSFFDRREIRDAIAYMKVFVNPDDDVNLLRIANVPARGLSDATMEKLLALSSRFNCSVFKSMQNKDALKEFLQKTRDSIEDFVFLINDIRKFLTETKPDQNKSSLKDFLNNFFLNIRYYEELRKYEKNAETADNRIQNLKELIDETENFDGATLMEQLVNFLDNITLDMQNDDQKELPANAVTLITMHSCKGLEFRNVFIAGAEENLIPHSKSCLENRIDEERRLFYVAITRAMETLTISYCLNRKFRGYLKPCSPSRFLKDLPSNLVEDYSETSSRPITIEEGKKLFENLKRRLE